MSVNCCCNEPQLPNHAFTLKHCINGISIERRRMYMLCMLYIYVVLFTDLILWANTESSDWKCSFTSALSKNAYEQQKLLQWEQLQKNEGKEKKILRKEANAAEWIVSIHINAKPANYTCVIKWSEKKSNRQYTQTHTGICVCCTHTAFHVKTKQLTHKIRPHLCLVENQLSS